MNLSFPIPEGLKSSVDAAVSDYLEAPGDFALAIGIIRGEARYFFGYHSRAVKDGTPPDAKSIFELGSITKVFTSVLLSSLVSEGKVRLDDPIARHLPASVKTPIRDGREITLLHLATHTSGLPRLPDNFAETVKDEANPYAKYSTEDLYRYLATARLKWAPGDGYEYSNLGAGLLGHILSLVGGHSYEELVHEKICGPLGLKDTRVTMSPSMKDRLAPGHDESGELAANWDFPTLTGAGGLRSDVEDMLVFLEANLGQAPAGMKAILETCHEPRAKTAPGSNPLRDYSVAVFLGVLAVALQSWLHWAPGKFRFILVEILPFVISTFYGGFVPGLVTAALVIPGSYWLWGNQFGWREVIIFDVLFGWYLCRGRNAAAKGRVGLGWHLNPLTPKRTVIWHNGGTGGYATYTGFVKESQSAVVVLSSSAASVDDIGVAVLNALEEENPAR